MMLASRSVVTAASDVTAERERMFLCGGLRSAAVCVASAPEIQARPGVTRRPTVTASVCPGSFAQCPVTSGAAACSTQSRVPGFRNHVVARCVEPFVLYAHFITPCACWVRLRPALLPRVSFRVCRRPSRVVTAAHDGCVRARRNARVLCGATGVCGSCVQQPSTPPS